MNVPSWEVLHSTWGSPSPPTKVNDPSLEDPPSPPIKVDDFSLEDPQVEDHSLEDPRESLPPGGGPSYSKEGSFTLVGGDGGSKEG